MTVLQFPGGAGGFDSWKTNIQFAKNGGPYKTHENVRRYLTHHPVWAGNIRFDEFSRRVMVEGAPFGGPELRPWVDVDDTSLVMMIDRDLTKDFGRSMVAAGVEEVARTNKYHPVRQYFDSIRWDGEPRVDRFFVDCFGAPDTDYARGVSRRWLISAVARILSPGCKADCIPVLEGAQGIRKSSGIRALAGAEWFNDSELKIGHADGYAALDGKWLHEIAELSSFTRGEMRQVKAFATSQIDHYRGAYERRMADHKRQSVFICTTNDAEWHKDDTGGRRFWPLSCSSVNLELVKQTRDQVWAEAVELYKAGAKWWADTEEFQKQAMYEVEKRRQVDPWREKTEIMIRSNPDRGYTTEDILTGPFGFTDGLIQRADSMRMGLILRSLGLTRVVDTRRGGVKVRLYHLPHGETNLRND